MDLNTDGFPLHGPVRDWFAETFPLGPTPAQTLAWPTIVRGEHVLLVSPTGTGKTLAAFLAILDRMVRQRLEGTLADGLQCVYLSPLRSLGYDIERNLSVPLEALRERMGLDKPPVRVGVRTGDTSAYRRRALRQDPPHLLITTPESLSLLLSQEEWHPLWSGVRHLVVDEVHSLVPTKRGADLMVSLERLAAHCAVDPARVGLSATCRPAEAVGRFLVGPGRDYTILEAAPPEETPPTEIEVESLLGRDEAPHRGLTYRRLLRRLRREIGRNRTTVIFANTRGLTEKVTHDLRVGPGMDEKAVAAHHSALDARRRREVEAALRDGQLRAVVTSTSLELGVDIGTADLAVLIGPPGSVSRCLQRVGRAGHRVDAITRGLMLAATPSELAACAVTAEAARHGKLEPLTPIAAPLDVLCQQLIGMACADEWSDDDAYALVRRSAPMADLRREDFDACLAFLAGELPSPAGAYEPEPGATPRWSSPRIWKHGGLFGIRNRRVIRWFRSNVGTIHSEESLRVIVDGVDVGTVESAYAEKLATGDRFVLDGRALEFVRLDGLTVQARTSGGDPALPRWSSDRQGLSPELAIAVATFRKEAARLVAEGPAALRGWLGETYGLEPDASASLEDLIQAQEHVSEVPSPDVLLVEESPHPEGWFYAFHAPLGRPACEALGRAVASRLGRRLGRNLALGVADLGWSIRTPPEGRIEAEHLAGLFTEENLEADVLDGLDRGELLARRFRHVAGTALMVLKNPEGKGRRVGGLLWVSNRLYPLVKAACPDHPLLRETRREVLNDLLDTPGAARWLASRPTPRLRHLPVPSPFALAWIEPAGMGPGTEPLHFESPAEALRRLHLRLTSS